MADGGSSKESLARHEDGIHKDLPRQSSWSPSMARTLVSRAPHNLTEEGAEDANGPEQPSCCLAGR